MQPARFRPSVGQIFVCTNRRRPDDPLGGGCAERGDEVYTTLRGAVNRRGLAAAVWLTRTHCLGVCPRSGTAVALAPGGQLLTEVGASDAEALLAAVTARPRPAGGP